jgi:hypothetical protein
MLCRVGLDGRLGCLSRRILTAAATSPESDPCVVTTCLTGCVVRLVMEGSISFFLLLCCCVWGANHSLSGSVSRFVFVVLSVSFSLQRHVKLCSRKKNHLICFQVDKKMLSLALHLPSGSCGHLSQPRGILLASSLSLTPRVLPSRRRTTPQASPRRLGSSRP